MVTFLSSIISNACHSFSGVADRARGSKIQLILLSSGVLEAVVSSDATEPDLYVGVTLPPLDQSGMRCLCPVLTSGLAPVLSSRFSLPRHPRTTIPVLTSVLRLGSHMVLSSRGSTATEIGMREGQGGDHGEPDLIAP